MLWCYPGPKKGETDDDLVTKLAEMNPSLPEDTSEGLRSTLKQVLHGDPPEGAEGRKLSRKTQ